MSRSIRRRLPTDRYSTCRAQGMRAATAVGHVTLIHLHYSYATPTPSTPSPLAQSSQLPPPSLPGAVSPTALPATFVARATRSLHSPSTQQRVAIDSIDVVSHRNISLLGAIWKTPLDSLDKPATFLQRFALVDNARAPSVHERCMSNNVSVHIEGGTGQGASLTQNFHASSQPVTFSAQDIPSLASESDIYISKMLDCNRGYPLLFPAPQPHHPNISSGIAIGDVGTITSEGGFDYLFNVFSSANTLCPHGFHPLPRDDPNRLNASSSEVESEDIDPGCYCSKPIKHDIGDPSGTCGAILAFPRGARLQQLKDGVLHLRQYAAENAKSWYQVVINERGRDVGNSELFLVTGHEKVQSWGIAHYSAHQKDEDVKLTFRNAPGSTGYTWDPAPLSRVKLKEHGPVDGVDNRSWVQLGSEVWREEFPGASSSTELGSSIWSWLISRLRRGMGLNPPPVVFTFHPVRTKHSLRVQVPSATVAFSHTDDWSTLLEKSPEVDLLEPSNVYTHIQTHFKIASEGGAAFLEPREKSSDEHDIASLDDNISRVGFDGGRQVNIQSAQDYRPPPPSPSEIYMSHMLLQKRGYPLFFPAPPAHHPNINRGIAIGDVGCIDEGGFYYLFMGDILCKNSAQFTGLLQTTYIFVLSRRVRRLTLENSTTQTPQEFVAKRPLRLCLCTMNILSGSLKIKLNVPGSLQVVAMKGVSCRESLYVPYLFNVFSSANKHSPDGFEPFKVKDESEDLSRNSLDPHYYASSTVQCEATDDSSGPCGAILTFPRGSQQEQLENVAQLSNYTVENAQSWYQYVLNELGRDIGNGSLFLVTGHEKARSWGMVSYSVHHQDQNLTLEFRNARSCAGYGWEDESSKEVHQTVLKNHDPMHRELKNHDPVDGPWNQTLFLYGWTIDLGTHVWREVLSSPTAQTSSIWARLYSRLLRTEPDVTLHRY
ncbi:hypothetical protein R3P38DRAFT_2761228 [Favolaschia claudopus]|uniref:Uncharacterized protein n=1 Tax=Favolaschia claudopus TaxID=2862362 RepID=A0AAW0E056_9AGAR